MTGKPKTNPSPSPSGSADPSRAAATEPTRAPDLMQLQARLRRIGREHQQLFQRLVEGERRFRGLATAVWQVQEEERRRLARELHDGLGQTLTALKIQIERLADRAADVDPVLAGSLDRATDIAQRALQDARRLSHTLRPQVLDDLGLVPALRWLARSLEESTGFRVELEHAGLAADEAAPAADTVADAVGGQRAGGERLDPDLETLLFRVVQEALTNAIKHSGADGATVRLERRGGMMRLAIRDHGSGFDPEAAAARSEGGLGLRGMRDRVEVFGGRLRVGSAPGEGTTIEIAVPLSSFTEGGAAR